MSEPVITVKNLSKVYNISHQGARPDTFRDSVSAFFRNLASSRSPFARESEAFHALRDVSFEVQQGEVLGIIGRNGAGKSTLLKILSRITAPTSGRVTLRGRVASLLEVGTGFHPELTGRENIFLNGAILGMSREEIRSKFEEILDFSGVEKFLDTPVKRYSSGMYVRLAFAVAAHLEPEILIIDEVLAVGDLEFQQKCLGKMETVAASGRTVLFVSHQMNAVRQLCPRACLLNQGAVVAMGATPEIISQYTSLGSSQNLSANKIQVYQPDCPVVFKQAKVLDEKGENTSHLKFGRPWSLQADFQLTEAADKLVVALGIRTSLGVATTTTWSNPENLRPGRYRATFQPKGFHLEANSHHLLLGFSQLNRPMCQIDLGLMDFVTPQMLDSDEFFASTSGCGPFLNSCHCTIEPLNTDDNTQA